MTAWPIFALRVAFERTIGNVGALAVAMAMAVIQGYVMVTHRATGATPPVDAIHHIPTLVSKYFGTALYSVGQHGAGRFGVAVALFLAGGILALPKGRRLVYAMLALCLGVAILTSIARAPIDVPHPILAGPRYFFFPLILTGWMLLMLAKEAHRNVGLVATMIAGAYAPSLAAAFAYEPQVPKEPWSDQVAACEAAEGEYDFDIQVGLPQIRWSSTMRGDACRALQAGALFDRRSAADGKATPAGLP